METEFYGAIRGLITEIDTVSKRAWLQPIGADHFVEVCLPPDLDPATVFPKYVEVMGTVTKDANGRVVRVLAEQCRNMDEWARPGTPLQNTSLEATDE